MSHNGVIASLFAGFFVSLRVCVLASVASCSSERVLAGISGDRRDRARDGPTVRGRAIVSTATAVKYPPTTGAHSNVGVVVGQVADNRAGLSSVGASCTTLMRT